MFVLCGQAALIPSRQLDMVWELEYQQVKCLDELFMFSAGAEFKF